MIARAPAKLNLTLEVLGRRADGYHDLVSVLHTIDLADELRFALADDLEFACDDPALATADNLVVRAATALRWAAGVDLGARISLFKRVPLAAGLGGGSSDAATTLLALNRLWRLDWTRDQLLPVAAAIGSDVPFFLWGGAAVVEGRGERVRPLPPCPLLFVTLLVADAPVADKTRQVFAATTPADYGDGSATMQLIRDLVAGTVTPHRFLNTLTGPAERVFPALASARADFLRVGASPVLLTGAGPTLFAVTPDRAEADRWASALQAMGHRALVSVTDSAGSGRD